jgi:hypothetical protein
LSRQYVYPKSDDESIKVSKTMPPLMQLMQRVLRAQAVAEGELLAKQNVIGVAVGFKESEGVVSEELALIALVKEKIPVAQLATRDVVPRDVDGVRTDVYEVGDLRAQAAVSGDPKSRFRPVIPSGVSVGHTGITAGTLGTIVRDRVTGEVLLLSNNHVFANSNQGQPGDAILQPGPLDGGRLPADIVAQLDRFVPLRFIEEAQQPDNPGPVPIPTDPNAPGCLGIAVAITNIIANFTGSNQRVSMTPTTAPTAFSSQAAAERLAEPPIFAGTGKAMTVPQALTPDNACDAALARPLTTGGISFDSAILSIGAVSGTKPAQLGGTVRKSGRTTGLRQGRITLLNATVNITYDTTRGPRTARFTGQVICDPISEGGDSGSLVVDGVENRAVGLLFAGSPVATIFTPIDTVLAALNVTF